MKASFVLALLLASALAHADPAHPCAADAIKRAKALLVFHTGGDARAGVDDGYRLLAPLRNPVNPNQHFDVLEVDGYVNRANYRMRLIYAQLPGNCVLMGQEVLELSSL